ncbi:MAG: hypothetical protein ACXVHB_18495 [Solirubrobacteraceae bacterium]
MGENPNDPAIAAYDAVRAHELMLNEAVSRFEHARLAPLITLNGGAVVAFLTLLGALLGKDSGRHPDLWLSGLAVGAWVVGLVAGALAVSAAASQQTAISAAHRLLREGLEDALVDNENRAELLRGPKPTPSPPSPRAPRNPREWMKDARKRVTRWWAGPDERRGDWDSDPTKRKTEREDLRGELRDAAGAHALRFRARWWLSVAMFVTGATLALAAILSGG